MKFLLSPGNDHDSVHAIELLSAIDLTGSNVLGDKAYGTEIIRNYITENEAKYIIPPKSNNPNPWSCDWWLYKKRHLIENSFKKSNGFVAFYHLETTGETYRPDSILSVTLAGIFSASECPLSWAADFFADFSFLDLSFNS